ncbi:methyltransferase domain-containing protein [Nocardia sp. SYP-A9097]|uniref:class I SAM-dependent methyltransferase n=1 Tax=Nocardia sp. SYP-A9097 TaxID=2663237 RepID=UPI00129C0D19|nr:class I SAM-dependent methyltransferase [Nocardia sp. SYP-A9097]MRH87479.1 methyltransferase domain-containing protein [Nocardia sp. SYP-A9097]
MTKNTPTAHTADHQHDYLSAAGNDRMLPFYDLLTRALGARKTHGILLGNADLAPGFRVLEIGCGTGNLTLAAKNAQPGAEIVGSDPDPLALTRAQRKIHGRSGIRFDRAYAQDLPFPDASFDRVLSAFMLHHLDAEVKPAVAAEAFRVLRPAGELHVVDVGGNVTTADGFTARRALHNHHTAGNIGDGIPTLMRSAGFECSEVGHQVTRRMGRVTFYRATRPA